MPCCNSAGRRNGLISGSRTAAEQLQHRLQQCQRHALSAAPDKPATMQTQLELLNPQRTLDRGYAIIRDHKGHSCVRRSCNRTGLLTFSWHKAARRRGIGTAAGIMPSVPNGENRQNSEKSP
jgi:hypothetical protein